MIDILKNGVRRTVLIGLATFLAGTAISAQNLKAEDLEAASLRLKWLPQAQFIGYYVAKSKGWYEEEGIDLTINPGGPNIIAENMVGSGADTFGHGGGASSLLQAREKGLDIIGIGMIFQQTPYRFVALEASGIKEFSDVEGKTVSTWFSGPQFILNALLQDQGISPDNVNIEAQANSMVPFIEGRVDMATVTIFNEGLVLKRRGVTPAAVFNPADMGVNLPNEAIIVNASVIEENPELVQGFMNASIRGWSYALANEEEAVDILIKANPSADRTEQLEQMEQLKTLILYGPGQDKGVGYLDVDQLKFTNEFLVKNDVLEAPVDIDAAIDTSFWENVPEASKMVKSPG